MKRLIKISKPNCRPCAIVANQLHEMNVDYEEFSIKDDPSLIEKYNLTGVPVVVLLDDDDNELYRVSGVNPPELEKLVSMLD